MAALVCSIIEGDPRTAFARVQPAPSIEYWRASSTMSAVKDRSLIVNGRQPPQLNAKKLMRVTAHLPTDWAEQRALLGFR